MKDWEMGAADEAPTGPAKPCWEDDISPDRRLPSPTRHACKLRGVKFNKLRSNKEDCKPFLLATVQGVDDSGRPFCWIARRARKRVLQPHQCACPPPPVSWAVALDVRVQGRKPGWWVALLFGLGSLLFLISGIARETDAVASPPYWPPGLSSLPAALGPWLETAACAFCYTPAVFIAVLESTNMDWGRRMRAWEKGGRQPRRRPRLHVLPSRDDLRTVSWWATVIQFVGILCFNFGVAGDLVGHAKQLTVAENTWTVAFGFSLGSVLFIVAGALGCMEETGSWWRGLVPTSMADWHSISWQATFQAFWGAWGFLINGIALWVYLNNKAMSSVWVIGFGHILGSVLFLISSMAGMLEQANPGHL